MKIYVDENKGDRNSFYLLAYVYGESSNITDFERDAATIRLKHSNLGKDFKGIHANKIKGKNVKKYVEDILNLFKSYLTQNKLHYFILIQSINKLDANFGVVKDKLKSVMLKIKSQFPDLQPKDEPNIIESGAQLWGIFQYPEKFKNVLNADVYVDSCGAILNYATQKRTIINIQHRSIQIPFYDVIKIFARSVATTVSKIHKKTEISIDSYNAIADTSSVTMQLCDILSNYLFNALRKEKGCSNDIIVYKHSQITNLLNICPTDLKRLAINFDNGINCINDKAFMIFED